MNVLILATRVLHSNRKVKAILNVIHPPSSPLEILSTTHQSKCSRPRLICWLFAFCFNRQSIKEAKVYYSTQKCSVGHWICSNSHVFRYHLGWLHYRPWTAPSLKQSKGCCKPPLSSKPPPSSNTSLWALCFLPILWGKQKSFEGDSPWCPSTLAALSVLSSFPAILERRLSSCCPSI